MKRFAIFLLPAALRVLTATLAAQAQPYAGFVYPAGGQQGTTVPVRIGGQGLDGVHGATVTGSGVTAKLTEYLRRLNNQETQLLREQADKLKSSPDENAKQMLQRIEHRLGEHVQTPACNAIAHLAFVEVTIAKDAPPGRREIRLVTDRGISNPLAFHVGQLPEYVRKPMLTTTLHVLGKEGQSLRKRPAEEVESRITLPCTVNGQIASGEVNRYRFTARKGQRLVLSTLGRELVPFIADAVPGWFQPVLTLYDAAGKEVACNDDFRHRPDPVILYEVPRDSEYTFAIHDGLFRGREDFLYRVSAGELPFITSHFPMGRQEGAKLTPVVKGWNLEQAALTLPPPDAAPGAYTLTATAKGHVSVPVPFVIGSLPEVTEREPNNNRFQGQQVTLPVVINGRIEKPGDQDVFRFTGKGGETIVAEVEARRLDSPLDSLIRLTDLGDKVLAFNDDSEDLSAGANTHHADSLILFKLPADGICCLHLGDTARQGGEAYTYRLRLSAPQPGFDLRSVTSSARMRTGASAPVTVLAQRRDGFDGPITLALKDPPSGFSADPVIIPPDKNSATLNIKGPATPASTPVGLTITGHAALGRKTEFVTTAVPCDDRMQAFLWRQLLPAADLQVVVFDPRIEPKPKRPAPVRPAPPPADPAAKPKFTPQQVEARLRELKRLYEDGCLTDEFYHARAAECEAGG